MANSTDTARGRVARSSATPAVKSAAPTRSAAKTPAKRASGGAIAAAKKKSASAPKSKFFFAALRKAEKLKGKEGDLLSWADAADKKARRLRSGAGSKALEELRALLRLVRAYAKNDYREVSWESMALIVAGIIYVVNPMDLIPDVIPALGFLDDAAVLGFVLMIVRDELGEFLEWETANAH